jgi:hypothetical protein
MQKAWGHDSDEVTKIFVCLDGVWYGEFTLPYPGAGYYWPNYPVEFDNIVDAIKVMFSVKQHGYGLNDDSKLSYAEITKEFKGDQAFPNTPEVSSHCKTMYNDHWLSSSPAGIDLGWN